MRVLGVGVLLPSAGVRRPRRHEGARRALRLAGAGEGLVAIQQAGDWTSPAMPAYYCREILARDSAVARFHRTFAERPLEGSGAASL